MQNELWFTLNDKGYSVRYQKKCRRDPNDNHILDSNYMVDPQNRIGFAPLIRRLADKGRYTEFYASGVNVFIDPQSEIPIPREEKVAICALVFAMESRTKQNIETKSKLEKITQIIHEALIKS